MFKFYGFNIKSYIHTRTHLHVYKRLEEGQKKRRSMERANEQTKRENRQKTDINVITPCECILNVFCFSSLAHWSLELYIKLIKFYMSSFEYFQSVEKQTTRKLNDIQMKIESF